MSKLYFDTIENLVPIISEEQITITMIKFNRGDGSSNNPSRVVTSYFEKDGTCLCEKDEWISFINKYKK